MVCLLLRYADFIRQKYCFLVNGNHGAFQKLWVLRVYSIRNYVGLSSWLGRYQLFQIKTLRALFADS